MCVSVSVFQCVCVCVCVCVCERVTFHISLEIPMKSAAAALYAFRCKASGISFSMLSRKPEVDSAVCTAYVPLIYIQVVPSNNNDT